MKTWLNHFWEKMRNSYWLIPASMLLAVIALSYGLLAVDNLVDISQYRALKWLVFSSSEGSGAVLSTIAASTFSAATLTFSVTMVTLSLTSSQFGPRLLRNFLRDPINQFTFGAFISTFIYCLLIMRVLVINTNHIPNISISLAVVMVLFDAALFIAFIHHLTSSIQVERITAEIGKELMDGINDFLPDEYTENKSQGDFDDAITDQPSSIIRADSFGYVQAINHQALSALAESENITIKLLFKPGQFVLTGAPLVEVWPVIHLKSHIDKPIRVCFLIGKKTSAEQDLEFTVRQLVQIAARALSPGINDPFTAMTCIDYLGAGLAFIATRNLPDCKIRNEQGRLLLIKHAITCQSLYDACFIVIRQMCANNPPVAIYLLETLAQLAAIVERQEDQHALIETAKLTLNSAIPKCEMAHDQQAMLQRFENIKKVISNKAS
ncbi:hypothetical protein AU255_06720 [Methyloprofundus sedimenti]|uniref:DUF2254 domain-containing protein n=1 Tax=Methyloprofundus sedimenti TaxID=1420851 RepID=A0A1V8M7L0_9GAMM|nr:DUF2254 domain-containing protein [Methyloprofundus sedimenti]OQK17560.1 hypothetical protein AU255_06720 [Methyloprofundus sedimenti]